MPLSKRQPLDWAAIIAAIIALMGTVYIESTHRDAENAQRISKLEQAKDDMTSKVDHIQQQVDRLVDVLLDKR